MSILPSRPSRPLLDSKWRIVVKREWLTHNHETSARVATVYSSNRIVSLDSPLILNIKLMVKTDSKTSKIVRYIRENSSHKADSIYVRNSCLRIKNSGAL